MLAGQKSFGDSICGEVMIQGGQFSRSCQVRQSTKRSQDQLGRIIGWA